ncbi:hypothetical protein ACU61A_22355 [Pseudonocardia sichuanensis]
MQLLSASALVPVGVGAVMIGVLILVVLAVRRRAQAPVSRGSGARAARQVAAPPAGAAMAEQPVAAAGPPLAARPAAPVCDAVGNTLEAPAIAEAPTPPAPQPMSQPTPPAARPAEAFPPAPPVVAAPVAAAEPVVPAQAPAPATSSPPHAGSGRTVAAAVAQAFAVRAAASRAGGPPPRTPGRWPDDEARTPYPFPAPDVAEPGGDRTQQPEPEPADPAVDADSATPPSGQALPGVAAFVPARPAVDEHGWSPVGTNGDAPPEPTADGGTASAAAPVVGEEPAQAAEDEPWSPAGAAEPAPAEPSADERAWSEPVAAAGLVPPRGAVDAEVVPPPRSEHDGAAPPTAARPAAVDARDRLLGVLLDDPERAVGAAVELEDCLRELDRLTDAMRHERGVLRNALHRLSDAGLRPAQLARLAGMPLGEVEELLAPAPAEQRA